MPLSWWGRGRPEGGQGPEGLLCDGQHVSVDSTHAGSLSPWVTDSRQVLGEGIHEVGGRGDAEWRTVPR